MTLDEAIIHAEDVSRSCNSECGREHKKLAEWLKDFKKYQWIPCSERLPDEDYCTGRGIQYSAEVLATVVNHGADDETFVDMLVTSDGEWKMVHPIDGDNNIADWCEVVAWMPLPKPYKGGTDG